MASPLRDGSVYPVCLREFDVLRVEDLTPGMRRVVLGGPAIGPHIRDGVEVPAVASTGFDDDVKILVPDARTGEFPFPVPRNTDQDRVAWTPGSFEHARTYTVRDFDAATGELTIDFVIHGTGLAASWARRAVPGGTVLIAGPKHSAALPRDVDWMLVAGDETALPAIGRCVEQMPSGLKATVIIEVAEPAHGQRLESAADVEYVWLYRSESGGQSRMVDAVRAARPRGDRPFLWVAGEALTIKPLRRWATAQPGLGKDRIEITGYWRRREVATIGGDAGITDTALDRNVAAEVHELAEVLAPLAIRSAVTVGLFTAAGDGAATAGAIAAAAGTDPVATEKLLRHLSLLGFFTRTGAGFALTPRGEALTEPDELLPDSLHSGRARGRLDLAFLSLTEVLRTGRAGKFEGGVFGDVLADDPTLADELHAEATRWAAYRAPALPAAIGLAGSAVLAVFGDGAGSYADNVARLLPDLRIEIIGLPSSVEREIAVIAPNRRERITAAPRSAFAPLDRRYDAIIGIGVLPTLADADARLLIATLRAATDRVVLVGDVLDPATTDDHDTEADLLALCLHGGGVRTAAEIDTLLPGGDSARVAPLGWGSYVVEITGA